MRGILICVTICVLLVGQAWADAEGPAAAGEEPTPATTEVVILGTLHGRHFENPNYGVKTIENILRALEPAAICVEAHSAYFNEDGRPREDAFIGYAEGRAELAASRALSIPLLPYDRERLGERYQETRHFERQQAAGARYREWLQESQEKEPDSLHVQLADLLDKATWDCQPGLMRRASPEIINSDAYDGVTRIKHKLWEEMLPPILAEAGYEDVVDTWLFIRDEWRDRNRIMAENILAIAPRFPGERIVVVTGAEHRYILHDLLSEEPTVTLKEFWEVIPDDVRARDRPREAEHFAAFKLAHDRVDETVSRAWLGLVSWREVERAHLALLEIDPFNPRSRCCLGSLYVRWGDYERVLSLLPEDATILQRAFAFDALGRREEAVAIYEQEVKKTHNPTTVVWARRGLEGPVWYRDLDIRPEPDEVRLSSTPSWRASASDVHAARPLHHAIDGDLRTFWSTRPDSEEPRGQFAGQWFVLDFGSPQTLSRVVFDHQGVETINVHSWPHAARASISADGSTWEEVDHVPAGPLEPLTLTFDPAQPVRALRLELTEEYSREWWSIHEVYVFARADASED